MVHTIEAAALTLLRVLGVITINVGLLVLVTSLIANAIEVQSAVGWSAAFIMSFIIIGAGSIASTFVLGEWGERLEPDNGGRDEQD